MDEENKTKNNSSLQKNYNLLVQDETAGMQYQRRRLDEWTENYLNYRNKVTVNRITQRQSISFPITKDTLKAIVSNIDDFTGLKFTDLGNDKQKEIFKNAYWDYTCEISKMKIKDIIDKRNVCIYGRSFKMVNIIDGDPIIDIIDPYDILVSPYTDPADIQTAGYIIHKNIFTNLNKLKENPDYDKGAIKEIEDYFKGSEVGKIKANLILDSAKKKNDRLKELGFTEITDVLIGDLVVELKVEYKREENNQIFVYVICQDKILMRKSLREMLYPDYNKALKDFYPISSWGDDFDQTDFWSDGPADVLRPIHKVLNIKISQNVENSVLRGLGMQFFDSTAGDGSFDPTTYTAMPFGFYGVPGDPNKIIKRMDIADVTTDQTLMDWLRDLGQRATSVSSQIKGVAEKGVATLGEVQILQSNIQETFVNMAIGYRQDMIDIGNIWSRIVDNNPNLNVFRAIKTVGDRNYSIKIDPYDFRTELGYKTSVMSKAEKEKNDIQQIQKLAVVSKSFPQNQSLQKILKNKLLDILDLSNEEIREVMDEEKRIQNNPTPEIAPNNEPNASSSQLNNTLSGLIPSVKETTASNPDLNIKQ